MKTLETENGTTYNGVKKESISSALTSLNTTDNTFAILEIDDGSLIQVANNGKKGFYVEIQNSKTKNRIQCDKNISEIKDVISLFVEFESNNGHLFPPNWIKTQTPLKYHTKLFQKLSYIGLVLIAVSLYFIFTKNFENNPFAKFIMLIGTWLMVPDALIDTVNLISELRRGIFDSIAMRAPVIIICAVLLTLFLILK
jgi:hypothetical protein